MSTTLSVIAKTSAAVPTPYAPVACANFLSSQSTREPITLSYVYTLEAAKSNTQLQIDGVITDGPENVLRALAVAYPEFGLVGASAEEASQVDALIAALPANPPAFAAVAHFLDAVDTRLTLRSFLVGHDVTIADWAVWGFIKASPAIAGSMMRKGQHVHLARWFDHIDSLPSVAETNITLLAAARAKVPPIAKEDKAKANATFDMGLPNAIKGGVVTRFPPEPSGYLHIGHAKAAILNKFFANFYEGKFLIRFDDTNPSKEKAEFEQSIVEDLALLGIKGDAVSHTSDFFDELTVICVKMIENGKAYADDTVQEKMREERMDGIASARRESTPAESLARFTDMASGSEEGKRWCIRAKISPDDPNKAMRDPVIYRGNALPHHRTGTKYKVYPTYDFACPVVDSLEGVTHALRTNEYRDRNPQYQWMLDAVGLRKVEVWDFGRVNFVYTLLSKRKLKWFVDEKLVRGWDDPRFPTVRGVRRRGMTIEALTQYMLMQGPSQAVTNLEWDAIWNMNKKVIDPVAPRFVALETKDLVKVKVTGEGTPTAVESRPVPKHKKNPAAGTKQTVYSNEIYFEQADASTFALNEEFTLMDWGNAFVREITRDADSIITGITLELNLGGDFKKTEKKITWLSAPALFSIVALDYDYLVYKKKLMDEDKVEDFVTPVTEFSTALVSDLNVKELKKGDIIQLEKKGYHIVDKPWGVASELVQGLEGEERVEMILIPDGKSASTICKYTPPAGDKPVTKVAAATPATKLPEFAPAEAQDTILKSEGTSGFDMKVTTKMFKVPNIYGEHEGVQALAETVMHEVKPVYDM